jgi:manganese/zinc/iron transport system permease protein
MGGILIACAMSSALTMHAADFSHDAQTSVLGQSLRFLRFQDPAVRFAVAGAVLLGISCGLLGAVLVVRRLSLVGDALSHAVLPGVAAGFLWSQTKDPLAIFLGAVAAGLLGTLTVGWIQRTTRLKEDAALGIVLAGFYSVGICMVTMIQRLPTGNKSGIDKFLFGQAAAIGAADLRLMGVITVATVLLVLLFYKELLVTSFDSGFARAAGFPVRLIHDALMLLLAFAVVSALQAVGVVLVSAMLITPAAAAYLLTERFHRMLALSAIFGVLTGVVGCFVSFLGTSLPTGPLMVLAASMVFGAAFLFAPQHGVVVRWRRERARDARVRRENTLKAIFHILESRDADDAPVTLDELAARRGEDRAEAIREARQLVARGQATADFESGQLSLTPEGRRLAHQVIRSHRLWELYLTSAARLASDHVHEDAEHIEHILGPEVIRELERRLGPATHDPHGRRIPVLETSVGEAPLPPRTPQSTSSVKP